MTRVFATAGYLDINLLGSAARPRIRNGFGKPFLSDTEGPS